VVCATEDSWEHTIAPRLLAAGADLSLVFRVDVLTSADEEGLLNLPHDIHELERVIEAAGAVLVVLDPLMSRLDVKLDTHKDAEVRSGLEPLVAFAKRANVSVLGIMHVNKSTSADPLTVIMGSRAFPAVARAVLVAMKDPEDESRRLLGLEKSNLGSRDQPTYIYRIVKVRVAQTDEGDVFTGKVEWLGNSDRSVSETMAAAGDARGTTATAEAVEWLCDYMESVGGRAASSTIKEAGKRLGHSLSSLNRARVRLGITAASEGFPRQTYWTAPVPGEA
jgi:hypothetical protein